MAKKPQVAEEILDEVSETVQEAPLEETVVTEEVAEAPLEADPNEVQVISLAKKNKSRQ